MVLYFGSYNPDFIGMSRGKRKKKNQDELIPYILEPEKSSKGYKKNWASLPHLSARNVPKNKYNQCDRGRGSHPPTIDPY